ncbi:Choline transporter-like protein [Aduncisulcus paluster]|uniref:Choline transporter-like protein n=1 Tax=Aduncisulcus paluster TaxID=2918883 RepID=A0ABQ5K011_9EUKA|nr:Choline transporter-like protein [Aduncisulcus paluster]
MNFPMQPAQQGQPVRAVMPGQNQEAIYALNKGETLKDDSFTGVVEERKCRDCFFFFLFVCVILGCVFCWYYYQFEVEGTIVDLLRPLDNHGRFCGKDLPQRLYISKDPGVTKSFTQAGFPNDITEYNYWIDGDQYVDNHDLRYMFYSLSGRYYGYNQVFCVEECPTFTAPAAADATDPTAYQRICSPDFGLGLKYWNSAEYTARSSYVNIDKISLIDYDKWDEIRSLSHMETIADYECGVFTYQTEASDFYDRCFPSESVETVTIAAIDEDSGLTIVSTIESASQALGTVKNVIAAATSAFNVSVVAAQKWTIILSCLASIILSFLILLLIRLVVKLIVWIILIGIFVGGCIGSFMFIYMAKQDYTDCLNHTGDSQYVDCSDDKIRTLKIQYYGGIALAVATGIYLILVCCLGKRINLALTVMQVAAKAIAQLWSLVFMPILFFVLAIVAIIGVAYVALLVYVSGDDNKMSYGTPEDGGSRVFDLTNQDIWILLALLLIGLWFLFFSVGLSQIVVAGVISTWYYAGDQRDEMGACSPRKFLSIGFWYHLGTVAIGSFLIAFMTWIRIMFEYLASKIESKDQNEMISFAIKCVRCCLACLDRFLKFITKMAYIVAAVYNYGFFKAAKHAAELVLRHPLRMATLQVVGDSVLFLINLLCSGLAAIGTAVYVYYVEKESAFLLPTLITLAFSLAFNKMFTSVLETAIDAIFISLCEDEERNDGSASKPYKAPKKLLKYMEKN